MAGTVFYFSLFENKPSVINNSQNEKSANVENIEKNNSETSVNQDFFVSGWLPYWSKTTGVIAAEKNLSLFSEINPFAFGVNPDGNLSDPMRLGDDPWSKIKEEARKNSTAVVPTILWTDDVAMHQVFSDPEKLKNHISAISNMLKQKDFPGVDIDYEGKNMPDRELFSNFLESLRQQLIPEGKHINCTVEARSQDNPPSDWTGTQAMSFANDYSALNKFCDSVRIMAYDQVFQTNGMRRSFENSSETPFVPNADIRWVETVMRYAARFIKPEKLIMGVPTYGWEFSLTKTSAGYKYTRVKSVSYQEAMGKAAQNKIAVERNAGGELSFIYQASDGKHIIVFSDAEAVRQKIILAKNLGIKGISLFKVDGLSDPKLFSVIKEETAK